MRQTGPSQRSTRRHTRQVVACYRVSRGLRAAALSLVFALLAGCLHAQLNGSIAGATITITELRNPAVVATTATSADESLNIALYGEEAWNGWNAVVRHWLLGIFTVDGRQVSEGKLYLVTASGGVETDMNRDLQADANPTPVSHDWRAIMTGEQVLDVGYKVSALTEAAYRWIAADINSLDDNELLARLDSVSAALVSDVTDDGVVDYGDLLSWTRILNAGASFKGEIDTLNAFSDALVLGGTESALDELAFAIMGPAPGNEYWRQLAAEIDDGSFATAAFLYAQEPDPDFCVAGSLSQAAKDRQLRVVNEIRALHDLPAVSYSSTYDGAVQGAALIQHANNYLSHFPMPGDNCFTEAGAQASGSANLSGGFRASDPAEDMINHVSDARNVGLLAAAGHRRSTLNPFMAYTAYGQVEGRSAQKVFGFDAEPDVLPEIQVDYVAFPYETYPYLFISADPAFPTPWSFTVVEDKLNIWGNQRDYFSAASVNVTRLRDGEQMAITDQYHDSDGFGVPNFFSWQVPDWEYDTRYRVDIGNVSMASGELRDYSYEVFIDYAGLVDLHEPLEAGDSQSGNQLQGSIADGDDRDSYMLELGGSASFTGRSQYSNQAFYILLYGPDKQLVRAQDQAFTVSLEPGLYTVVVSACSEGRCYVVNTPTQYEVDISLD